ncbi:MAG: hypothetical protein CW338_11515, partial [Clostridiales bacterium]|nr:hypothetical protein [Clostridiales bacterium]
MKKMLAFILGIVMLVCLFAPAMAEEAELIYIFGGASDPNRAKLKKMGQQSWYPMYSTQINAGENIDLSTFKECMLTETGMWKPAEEAVIKSYEPGHEDEDMVCTGPWFTIRKDGYQVGDNGFSSAVKWVCEVDGVYDVFINYSGGTSEGGPDEPYYDLVGGYYVPATDGVYM